MKKRSIISIMVIVFLLWILIGSLFFMYLEKWSFVNAFYFTVMTATTVGYGDFVPTDSLSKIFTALFSLVSIPLVVFVFGVLISSFLGNRMKEIDSRLHQIASKEEKIEEEIEEK